MRFSASTVLAAVLSAATLATAAPAAVAGSNGNKPLVRRADHAIPAAVDTVTPSPAPTPAIENNEGENDGEDAKVDGRNNRGNGRGRGRGGRPNRAKVTVTLTGSDGVVSTTTIASRCGAGRGTGRPDSSSITAVATSDVPAASATSTGETVSAAADSEDENVSPRYYYHSSIHYDHRPHEKLVTKNAAGNAPTPSPKPSPKPSPASSSSKSVSSASASASPKPAANSNKDTPNPNINLAVSEASDTSSMLSIMNEYRARAGLGPFKWSDKLASNALATCKASGGKGLNHVLNPGTFGQVMVFGSTDNIACGHKTNGQSSFGLAWYSWLCEVPSGKGLGSQFCDNIYSASNINAGGQTGHYDILSDGKYTEIGCGFYRDPGAKDCDKFAGVWTCDVAY